MFLQMGLDSPNQIDPAQQITLFAHAPSRVGWVCGLRNANTLYRRCTELSEHSVPHRPIHLGAVYDILLQINAPRDFVGKVCRAAPLRFRLLLEDGPNPLVRASP